MYVDVCECKPIITREHVSQSKRRLKHPKESPKLRLKKKITFVI